MSLKIYNTKYHKKTPFTPIEDNHVKMYVCGITSYDYCHIGHARSALVFDMIYNYLLFKGYQVTFVRNFTDIDDKIINRANEQNTTSEELANRFIDEFYTDMNRLGIKSPSIEPKATEHIPEIIEIINTLVDKGIAYQAGNDVYFEVNKFSKYGALSGRNLDDLQAGARISVNDLKKNPMDFALWKGSKPGEPTWESPWGPGRPGWHIECSAMSRKYLGDTFDIHGGGEDLVFPHHENEVAQSEGASCKPFVNYWIHHAFVTISDEKMSKSLNNFLTIREVLERHHPEALRLMVFSTHYRNPLDFSDTTLNDSQQGVNRLYSCLASCQNLPGGNDSTKQVSTDEEIEKLNNVTNRFCEAMDNDFNTAQALGVLFEGVKTVNRIVQALPKKPASADVNLLQSATDNFIKLSSIMGLIQQNPEEYFTEIKKQHLLKINISSEQIDNLVQERIEARNNKDWSRADAIRDQLLKSGIELKDNPDGTTWKVAN